MVEVLIVLAVVIILAVLVLPLISVPRTRPPRIQCLNNQKQVALGFILNFDAALNPSGNILMGDRHLNVPIDPRTRIARLTSESRPTWTVELHREMGSAALADGSVQTISNSEWPQVVMDSLPPERDFIRLGIP